MKFIKCTLCDKVVSSEVPEFFRFEASATCITCIQKQSERIENLKNQMMTLKKKMDPILKSGAND